MNTQSEEAAYLSRAAITPTGEKNTGSNEPPLPWKLIQSLPARFRSMRFRDMDPPPPYEATGYCFGWRINIPTGLGLTIIGPTGTGKTTLAVAVINELGALAKADGETIEHKTGIRFITAHGLNQVAKDFDNPEAYQEYRNVKLLVLDDVGATRSTEFTQDELAALIDYRYSNRLATILTSNLNMADFKTYIGERTLSRLLECNRLVMLSGPDRRKKETFLLTRGRNTGNKCAGGEKVDERRAESARADAEAKDREAGQKGL